MIRRELWVTRTTPGRHQTIPAQTGVSPGLHRGEAERHRAGFKNLGMIHHGLSRWRPALLWSRCRPVHSGFQYRQTPEQNRGETGRHRDATGVNQDATGLYTAVIAYRHTYQDTKGTSRVRRTYVSRRNSYSSICSSYTEALGFFMCTFKFVARMWQVRYAVHSSHVRRKRESNVAGTP